MKKTVVIIISIVVALCLALTGLGVLLKNEPESSTTTTTGAPTSTTSGTITTSSTTSTTTSTTRKTTMPGDSSNIYVELKDLLDWEQVSYIEINAYDARFEINWEKTYKITEKNDVQEFLDVFLCNNVAVYGNASEIEKSWNERRESYRKNEMNQSEIPRASVYLDVWLYDGNGQLVAGLILIPNNIAKIHSEKGTFCSVDDGGIDWLTMMQMYIREEDFGYEN